MECPVACPDGEASPGGPLHPSSACVAQPRPACSRLCCALGPQASSSTSAMGCGTARRHPWPLTRQGLLTAIWTSASDTQPRWPEVVAALRDICRGLGGTSLSPPVKQQPPMSATPPVPPKVQLTVLQLQPVPEVPVLQTAPWQGPLGCGWPYISSLPSEQRKQALSSPAGTLLLWPQAEGRSPVSLPGDCSGIASVHTPDHQ